MRDIIATETCVATARWTGQRCRLYPTRGTTVCKLHGGQAPQVRRGADVRKTVAHFLRENDRRSPAEVLLDALAAADALMRAAKVRVEEDEPLTVAEVTGFTDAVERASRLSKTVLDARVQAMIAGRLELEGEQMARVLVNTVERLDLDPGERRRALAFLREELAAARDAEASPRPPEVTS